MKYYILSKKWTQREDQVLTWWGPDHSGYVYDLDKAGLYTKEDAEGVAYGTHGAHVPVSEEDVNKMARRMVRKEDDALAILYDKAHGYDYRAESRPLDKHCHNCG